MGRHPSGDPCDVCFILVSFPFVSLFKGHGESCSLFSRLGKWGRDNMVSEEFDSLETCDGAHGFRTIVNGVE